MEKVYAVDFEGNGEPQPDIVELALVELVAWKDVGRTYCWLFRPSAPITKFVSRIHGLTDEDVASAPNFGDVEDDLQMLLDDATLIGHNARGDVRALKRKMPDWSPRRTLDTMQLAKRLKPGLSSYGLQNLLAALDIKTATQSDRGGRPHSALFDACATASLFLRLTNENTQYSLEHMINFATVREGSDQTSLL